MDRRAVLAWMSCVTGSLLLPGCASFLRGSSVGPQCYRARNGTHCEEASSLAEHKLKDVRERMADLARMEAVLSDLVCACHARKGNVSCPLIASLQGKKEPRSADAV